MAKLRFEHRFVLLLRLRSEILCSYYCTEMTEGEEGMEGGKEEGRRRDDGAGQISDVAWRSK